MVGLLDFVLPKAWQGRRLVWRSYTLTWSALAAAARQTRDVTVEDDFIPLFARGYHENSNVPANGNEWGNNQLVQIDMAGRLMANTAQQWSMWTFNQAEPRVMIVTQPPILYVGDSIAVELTNNEADPGNEWLTFHGVAAQKL